MTLEREKHAKEYNYDPELNAIDVHLKAIIEEIKLLFLK